jgi:outer membrane lipoprotein carrier protein
LIATGLAIATPPGADDLLNRVQASYQSGGDLTASFKQVFVDKLRGKKREESGTLWAKRDGRVRWSYLSPVRKDFVFDGKSAYFYEPENAQVTVFDRFQDSPLANAVRFLWGQGDLRDTFTVEPCRKDCGLGQPGDVVLELWPKVAIPTVDHSLLVVDPGHNRVKSSVVIDPLGNRTEYTFDKLVFGATIADAKFEFAVPKGVSVLRSTLDDQGKPPSKAD